MIMDADAIDRFAEHVNSGVEEVDGRSYHVSPKGATLIIPPTIEAVSVFSLSQLVSIISDSISDAMAESPRVIVNVESPYRVSAFNPEVDSACNRDELVETDFTGVIERFESGKWLNQEEMLISLQSQFLAEEGDDLKELIKLISSAKSVAESESKDDGVSQVLQAKAGIHLNQEVKVRNPYRLRPFMTFPEVAVEPIIYLLRSRQRGSSVEFALFDCDGGKHKIAYVSSIREFIGGKLADLITERKVTVL